MRRIKNLIRISFGSNIKLNIFITIVLLLVFTLFVFTIGKNNESSKYYIPKNMAYVMLDDDIDKDEYLKELDNLGIKYYHTIPLDSIGIKIDNPFVTNTQIMLADMKYIKEADIELVEKNQQKINGYSQMDIIAITYVFIPSIVATRGINLPIYSYYLDNIIVGNYPQEQDEVLIGETTANYFLEQKGLKHYKDLIGEEIEIDNTKKCTIDMFCIKGTYKISGVYKRIYTNNKGYDTIDKFIILPNEDIKNAYLQIYNAMPEITTTKYNEIKTLILNKYDEIDDEKLKEEILTYYQNTPIDEIKALLVEKYKSIQNGYFIEAKSYKQLKSVLEEDKYLQVIDHTMLKTNTLYKVVLILLILILNILLYLIYKKSRKQTKIILSYYKYSKLKVFLINLIPFIVFNVLLIILMILI